MVHLNLAVTPLLPLVRGLALAVAARAAGAAVLVHAHTGRIEECLARAPYRLAMRATLAVADTVVAVTGSARDALGSLGAGRAAHVVNGVDVERFRPGDRSEPLPTVAFVGTVCERKGLLDLRDALVELRGPARRVPLRLVVAGDGVQEGPGAFERIREAFREADLAEVEFAGAVDGNRVAELLAGAAVFCLPSHTEGSPLSLLEAMAAGAAPVATGVGDVPTILDGGRAGVLVPVRDPASLADALRQLLEDPAERDRLSRAARRRVEERYSWGATVDAVLRLYGQAAARRRRPPA